MKKPRIGGAIILNAGNMRELEAKNIALGFLWAWILLFISWVIAPVDLHDATLLRVVFMVVLALSYMTIYPFKYRLAWILINKYVFATSCLLLSGATLVAAFSSYGLIAPVYLTASVVVAALVSPVAVYACIIMMRHIATPENSTRSILLMLALAAGIVILASLAHLISPWPSKAVIAVCPLLLYGTMPVEAGSNFVRRLVSPDKASHGLSPADEQAACILEFHAAERVDWHYRHPIAVAFAVTGVCMGFAMQHLFGHLGAFEAGLCIAISMAVVAVGLFLFLRLTKREINSFVSSRLVFPWFMIVIMALPFTPPRYFVVLAGITVCVWTFNTALNMDIAFEIIKKMKVSTFAAFGQIVLLKYSGMAFGAALAWISVNILPGAFVPLVFFLSAMLAVVVSNLLPDKTTLPAWRLRRSYLYDTDEQLNDLCKTIALDYQLTPREVEVLTLLAKGRTARYIASSLTISETTSRTHMRNIYAKMNVNSHQMLLDIFEKTETA